MNRESLIEMAVGITAGLLIVVIAAYRSKRAPKPGVLRRHAMLALLTYAIIAAPVFTPTGMTFLGLLGLLIVVVLGFLGASLAGRFSTTDDQGGLRYAQALVSTGVAAVLLIATGQTLSLVGRVDPRVTVIVVGVVAALLVAAQGLVASSRISSLTVWLLLVPIFISLVLGFMLGSVPVVFSPIRVIDAAPIASIVAVAVAVFLLGWADNSLAATARIARWSPIRVLSWTIVVMLLVFGGLLMFFGGAIFAPSMEFFVVPSNIDALPGLAAIILAVLTVLFSALVANALNSAGMLGSGSPKLVGADASAADQVELDDPRFAAAPAWVWISAAIAIVVALIDPASDRVLVFTALIAAAVVGAQAARGNSSRATYAGVIVAVVVTIVLAAAGQLQLGWWAIAGMVITFIIAFAVGKFGAAAPSPQPQTVAVDQ